MREGRFAKLCRAVMGLPTAVQGSATHDVRHYVRYIVNDFAS